MNAPSNPQIVRSVFERYLNEGALDRLDEVFSADYSPGFAGANGLRGPVAFATPIQRLRAAFPDLRYTIDELLVDGDRVAVRWTWHGTFSGTYAGPVGTYAGTGKKVDSPGFGIFELANGKVVRTAIETDRLGVLVAIGAIPESAAFGTPPPSR